MHRHRRDPFFATCTASEFVGCVVFACQRPGIVRQSHLVAPLSIISVSVCKGPRLQRVIASLRLDGCRSMGEPGLLEAVAKSQRQPRQMSRRLNHCGVPRSGPERTQFTPNMLTHARPLKFLRKTRCTRKKTPERKRLLS